MSILRGQELGLYKLKYLFGSVQSTALSCGTSSNTLIIFLPPVPRGLFLLSSLGVGDSDVTFVFALNHVSIPL